MYQFDFQLTTKDWLKFQISHLLSNIYYHILFALVLIPLLFDISTKTLVSNVIIILLSYLYMWLFSLFLLSITCLLKKDYMFLTQQTITFNEPDILSQSKYGKSQIFWNNRTKITQRMGNVLVYISANYAILIPKRAFKTDTQRQEFIAFCKEQVAKSQLN